MGKLLYIQKCVHSARVFINRILALFRRNSGKKRIYLDRDFHKDIAWFLKFLPVFNGITYFKKLEVDKEQNLFLDASLTGLEGVWSLCHACDKYSKFSFNNSPFRDVECRNCS